MDILPGRTKLGGVAFALYARDRIIQDNFEDYYLLGYDAVYSFESQPTFRRNISPPFSDSNKLSKIPM
jgi:hypothetical protein